MKLNRMLLSLVLIVPALAVAANQQAGTPAALLGAALHLEEVEADLEAAIAKYEEILAGAATDRATAGRALLQIGVCYEKLGRAGARSIYERVVREYAEQVETAATASRLLLALTEPPLPDAAPAPPMSGVVLRQINLDGLEKPPWVARLSPDGGKFLYRSTDGAPYRLVVRDLGSGEDRTLIEDIGNTNAFEWSPDGTKVAYGYHRRELRLVDSSGGEPTVLWSTPGEQVTVAPLDWSRDGDYILAHVLDLSDWSVRLVIFPVAGAASRDLVSGPYDEIDWHGQFSPDGKFVAGVRTDESSADI